MWSKQVDVPDVFYTPLFILKIAKSSKKLLRAAVQSLMAVPTIPNPHNTQLISANETLGPFERISFLSNLFQTWGLKAEKYRPEERYFPASRTGTFYLLYAHSREPGERRALGSESVRCHLISSQLRERIAMQRVERRDGAFRPPLI